MKKRVGRYKNTILVEGDKNEFKPYEKSIESFSTANTEGGEVEGGDVDDKNYYIRKDIDFSLDIDEFISKLRSISEGGVFFPFILEKYATKNEDGSIKDIDYNSFMTNIKFDDNSVLKCIQEGKELSPNVTRQAVVEYLAQIKAPYEVFIAYVEAIINSDADIDNSTEKALSISSGMSDYLYVKNNGDIVDYCYNTDYGYFYGFIAGCTPKRLTGMNCHIGFGDDVNYLYYDIPNPVESFLDKEAFDKVFKKVTHKEYTEFIEKLYKKLASKYN